VVVWFTCVFVHNGIVISKESSEFSRSVRHGFEHIGQKSSLFKQKEKRVKNCNLTQSTQDNINALGEQFVSTAVLGNLCRPTLLPFDPFIHITERVMMWFLVRCCCSFIARLIALLSNHSRNDYSHTGKLLSKWRGCLHLVFLHRCCYAHLSTLVLL